MREQACGSPDRRTEIVSERKLRTRVFVSMPRPDNPSQNKRVESIEVACLDPGSTPGDSTAYFVNRRLVYGRAKKTEPKYGSVFFGARSRFQEYAGRISGAYALAGRPYFPLRMRGGRICPRQRSCLEGHGNGVRYDFDLQMSYPGYSFPVNRGERESPAASGTRPAF